MYKSSVARILLALLDNEVLGLENTKVVQGKELITKLEELEEHLSNETKALIHTKPHHMAGELPKVVFDPLVYHELQNIWISLET